MIRARRSVFALAGALFGIAPGVVRAEEPGTRVRLAWVRGDGAESCLDQPQLEARVAARLGRNPFAADAPLALEGAVTRTASAWHADLRVRDQARTPLGHRELDTTADDCGPLGDAVVLAVALTIDPEAAARDASAVAAFESPPAPVQVTPAPRPVCPTPPACPVAPPCPACAGPPPRLDETSATVRAVAAAGLLPGLRGGPSLAARYRRDAVEVALGFTWLPVTRTDDGRFAFSLTFGSAGAGYRFALGGRAALSLCGELEAGAIHADVLDVGTLEPRSTGDQLWIAGALGPRIEWAPGGALRLEAGALAVLPISAKQFVISGAKDRTVFDGVALGALGYVGIGVGGS